ncbi:MAG TPA: RNA methyltransferase [Anaerolineae bacterium]
MANPKVKYVRRLQSDRRFRAREKAFVIEGTRWLTELVQWVKSPQLILYTKDWLNTADNGDILQQLDAPAQPVSDEVMAAMSATTTPPGVLAIVPIHARPLPDTSSLLLILDRVKTPGNLGTMLRTAAAAGVDGVLLAPGCVDPYNPKVVRGSMGALLRLPVQQAEWPEIAEKAADMKVWLAAADGDVSYTAVNWRQPSALIIGSEAWGAGDEAQQVASGRVAIPMYAATESLNAAVAAGVILFEAVRQRTTGDGRPVTDDTPTSPV